jgi:hypothetical protein
VNFTGRQLTAATWALRAGCFAGDDFHISYSKRPERREGYQMINEPCPTCGHYEIPRYVQGPSVTAVLRPFAPGREALLRQLCTDAEVAMWQRKAQNKLRNRQRTAEHIRENVARGKLLGTY